jgi:membrane protease YdiL (CAAX protease family)
VLSNDVGHTMMDGVFTVLRPAMIKAVAWCGLMMGTRAGSKTFPPDPSYSSVLRARWTLGGAGLLYGLLWACDALSSITVFSLISHGAMLYPLLDIFRGLELIPSAVIIWVALRNENPRRVFAFRWNSRLWAYLLSCAFVILAVSSVGSWLDATSGIRENDRGALVRHSGIYRATWSIIMIGLVNPTTEELLFRGVILDSLRRRVSIRMGGLMCAALFAVAHGGALFGTLSYFCSGVVLNWLRDRYDSLLPALLAHLATNLLVVVAAYVV